MLSKCFLFKKDRTFLKLAKVNSHSWHIVNCKAENVDNLHSKLSSRSNTMILFLWYYLFFYMANKNSILTVFNQMKYEWKKLPKWSFFNFCTEFTYVSDLSKRGTIDVILYMESTHGNITYLILIKFYISICEFEVYMCM